MRPRRAAHPLFTHDALPLPLSAVEIELRDFQQVATGQPQPSAGLRNVHRGVEPLYIRNAERPKQLLERIAIRACSGCFLEHFAQREDSSRAITEVASVGRLFHMFARVSASPNRQIEN